jgi:succinate dehydrogenase / fumarate reductase membrane anchor subunit
MTDFKTPLSKVRGLGSAKDGTHHWWVQRVTAIANIPLVLFMVISFVGNAGKGHADWVAWLQQPVVAVLTILFLLNVTYHMRLGLQVVIEDYVHGHGTKIASLLLITFACVLIAALGVFSVLRIAFGG